MFKGFVFCFGMLLLALDTKAQGVLSGNEIEGGTNLNVMYHRDYTGKIYFGTRGMGFLFRKSKHITAKHRNYFEIDACNLKHPKEMKVVGEAIDRKRFVYGKLNNVLLLKGAIGGQKVFYHKADAEAVEVRYSYSFGPTIGFLKPYYVQVYRNSAYGGQKTTSEVLFNEETFTVDSIVGRASFFKGLDETKIYPGITAKFNLSFEYAHYTNIIRALEVGVCIDYFPQQVAIMARNPAENLIVTLQLGFVFGRKFY